LSRDRAIDQIPQPAAKPANTASTKKITGRPDGKSQEAAIGTQFAGRVGLFLRVDDFDETYLHMQESGVVFASEPRSEPYGKVAVFVDIAGNRWDLLSRR
jgi:predicted enzyme related to lactoylglutathione lyase